MTNKMKNVPELRFPEFIEEWEEKRLGDLYKYQQGQQIPVENQYKIQINNMKRFIRIVDVTENPKKRYIKDRKESGLINQKDLIMIRYGASAGTISMGYEGVIANNLFKFVKKQNVDNRYFYFLLKKSHFKIKSLSSQSAMPALNFNAMDTLKFSIPQYSEQQKIGSFFSKLDRQIELEEQKLAKLEEQKKGYMQKIFSQELRFKDGNGNNYSEWIKTNLKFLVSYKNGKGYEKEVVQNGKYNIINLNSISTKGMLKDSGKYTDFEDITLKKNDLIMILSDVAKGNLIGKTAIIDQDDKYLLNQRVASLRIKDESTSNVLFIYYFINYFRQYFINMSTGMSQLNINKSTVEDFLIYLPYIEEQDKIGNFFSNLDKSIIKQLDKIELLKERKKGFLQKMFV